MNSKAWSGRPVLVTGAGGFIGSHLAETLARAGASVRAFVRYNSRGDYGWLERAEPDVAQEIEVFRGDLANPEAVTGAMAGREVVFHLGALIPIPYSYRHPREFVTANVEGTLNVLEAARREEPTRIVHTSTSEVYGTAQTVPIDEEHPLHPQSPYAASKVGADQLALSFQRSFGTPVVDREAVQHLRSAPERARRDPDDRHAGAVPRRDRARRDRPDARLPLRRGHGAGGDSLRRGRAASRAR